MLGKTHACVLNGGIGGFVLSEFRDWALTIATGPALPTLGLFVVLVTVIHYILSQFDQTGRKTSALHKLFKSLGGDQLPSAVFFLALVFWILLFVVLFLSVLFVVFEIIDVAATKSPSFGPESEPTDGSLNWDFRLVAMLGGLTAVFGAVVAFPFTVIRLRLSQREAEREEQRLFNDDVKDALEGLYAQRQVTVESKGTFLDVWEDDIARRRNSIDRLVALAERRPEETNRILKALSGYVRDTGHTT